MTFLTICGALDIFWQLKQYFGAFWLYFGSVGEFCRHLALETHELKKASPPQENSHPQKLYLWIRHSNFQFEWRIQGGERVHTQTFSLTTMLRCIESMAFLCMFKIVLSFFCMQTQKVVGQEIGPAHRDQIVVGQLPALPNRLRRQWTLTRMV